MGASTDGQLAAKIRRDKVDDVLRVLDALGQNSPGVSPGTTLAAAQVRREHDRWPWEDVLTVRPTLTSEWALHRALHDVRAQTDES